MGKQGHRVDRQRAVHGVQKCTRRRCPILPSATWTVLARAPGVVPIQANTLNMAAFRCAKELVRLPEPLRGLGYLLPRHAGGALLRESVSEIGRPSWTSAQDGGSILVTWQMVHRGARWPRETLNHGKSRWSRGTHGDETAGCRS